MIRERDLKRIVGVVVVAGLLLLPWLPTSEYILHLATLVLIWALATASLNLLVGYTGPESFAHGAFFGIGGYTTVILTMTSGVPMAASMLLGGLLSMVLALVIALPSLRLRGIFFAILTLAFQIIYGDALLVLDDWTGGVNGLSGIPSFPGVLGVPALYVDYYSVVAVVFLSIAVLHRIAHSSIGNVFYMIKQDEELTNHLGYSVVRFKILSFLISAFFVGLAGGLYAQHATFFGPTNSDIFVSLDLFVNIVVGGAAAAFWGPIVASTLLISADQVLGLAASYSLLLRGILLLVVVLWFPRGLAGIEYEKIGRWVSRRSPTTERESKTDD